jgi:hypothetical protein
MGLYTQRFSEGFAPLVHEPADALAAAVYNSNWVSMAEYHRAVLILSVGTMAATATLNVLLQEATDATGTGAQAIVGKAITQLTQAGGDGDDLVCIELRSEEMDAANNYDFLRVQVTVANAQVELAYVLFGMISRHKPVPVANWTEVVG